MAPFSEAPQKNVPQGTEAVIVDAKLPEVKRAFVNEGVIVQQNSDSQFETKPKDYDFSGSLYCQGFDEGSKTRVVLYVRPEGLYEEVDDARIVYNGNERIKPAFSWVADIMDRNNLAYEFE
jgi:hypothetical protein